jgi:uncharacterized protein (DUF885 family)
MDEGASEVQRVAQRVTRLADAYVAEFLARFPDRAENYGLVVERHDRLRDNSLDGLAEWHALEDGWARELDGIDEASLRGRPEWVTLGFLREAVAASRGARICRFELWPANHLDGWQADLAQLAEAQPVGTDEARAEALARWSDLPRFLDTEVEILREGLRLGYSTPRRPVELLLDQLDALLASPVEAWSFFSPAERDGSPSFAATWTELLRGRIGPAVVRYREFVRDEYVSRAREDVAITAHPDGEAAYHASFRAHTTIERTAAETFELGSRRVAANLAEALALGRERLGIGDIGSLVARITTDPANAFASREDLLAVTRDAVARSRKRVSTFFTSVPDVDLVIEPYPAHVERESTDDTYWPAADDGSRPARYLVAAYHWACGIRSGREIVAFHEAYPGHHLQVSVARAQTATHPIVRAVSNAGYDEGWARYAEALAEEMWLYTSDYARIGRRLWPARGMVVDPGIHLFGWSRERATAFMAESGRMTRDDAWATVDRIAVWPGQFAAYDTGGLELFALRAEAEAAFGDAFDIRAFHDVVLGNGPVTLPMLRQQVQTWIDRARR